VNLLADECVAGEIVSRLRNDGHSIESAGGADAGTVDDDLLARAVAAGRVLLTADKDFGELVFRLRRAHAGIVLLRFAGVKAEVRAELVSAVFRDRSAELPGNFTVIDRDTVRVRKPPS
jgi:predicted nuclease of predicted toxin-antitoxin system